MCYIHQESIIVFYECEVSHSFIYFKCVWILSLKLSLLPSMMAFTTTDDGSVETTLICKNSSLQFLTEHFK